MNNKLLIAYLFCISNINVILAYPILYISKFFTNRLFNFYYNTYAYSVAPIIKYYYKTKFYIQNKDVFEELLSDDYDKSKSILIQNHLSQLDFIFLHAILSLKNSITNINLKSVTHFYSYLASPGFGMICYLSNAIMITYNKIKNIILLNKCKIKNNDILFLCPEGNVFSKENKKSNDKYCDENNINKMKNCLYPRLGAIEILQKKNNIDTIFVMCTQYDNIKPSGKYHTLLNTELPRKVYIKFDKYKTDDKICEKTVEIFRNIDNYLDKEIDESEYTILPLNKLEIFSLLFHLFVFMCGISALYNYNILFIYIIFVYIVYYTFLYFEIK